jgi:hypothetical protein
MNSTRPIWLSVFSDGSVFGEKSAANVDGISQPKHEGPSTSPAAISPITAGCLNATNSHRIVRDSTRMTANWIKRSTRAEFYSREY